MRTLYFGAVHVVGILLLALNAGCEERLQVPSVKKGGNFLGEIDTSFKPKLDQVSLQIRGLSERPTGQMREWSQAFDVGDNIVRINKSKISAIVVADGREKWTNTSKSGRDLRWLNHHLSIGLLQEYEAENERQERRVREPAKLSRIDLETGKWLPDLELDAGAGRKVETLLSALGDQQDLAVLVTSIANRVAAAEIPSTRTYDVLCFRGNDLKPRWIKSFAAGQSRPYDGVFVFGIPRPAYPFSNLQHLSWTEESLIVAVEALQPIRSLERESGVIYWELDRIWEFERGFIGPSVYSHYLGRFGIDDHRSRFVQGSDRDLETQAKIEGLAEARKKFEEQYSCAIIGGPIVVPLNPDRGGRFGRAYRRGPGSYSMFVAISKAPKRQWSNYISDCVVYELSESGQVLSMIKPPQMVHGQTVAVTNGGIVWACENDTLINFAPSKTIPHMAMGGSGSDLLTKLPWSHQSDYQPPDPWLDAWRLTTRVAIGKSFAAYVPAGGYVSNQTDHKFDFPITVVDLSSGLKHEAILELPIDGEISKPESRFPDRNDRKSVNPYLLGISDVRVSNNSLEVTLGLAEWSATMTFDMSHLLNSAGPPQSPKRIRQFGTRPPPQSDARTLVNELLQAIDDHDMEYVRILLKAGADPNGRNEKGWSPMMEAADSGTADIVDELITAGANIHLQSESRNGQTALMIAAQSDCEATRKIKLLLKAGARVNATNAGGKQTALMKAVRNGRLSAAAVLLSNGADPQVRDKDGHSLVWLATDSQIRSKSMIELLKKHGVTE